MGTNGRLPATTEALPRRTPPERCGFFETGTEFVPVLIRQRDHATDHGQPDRARLFTGLLDNLDTTT